MLRPHSYAMGRWVSPGPDARKIVGPVSGRQIAQAGGAPLDFAGMIDWAVQRGGPSLRAMTFHERARMLKALAQYLDSRKEALYAINPLTGATRKDGWIDIDGGIGTLQIFASKGRRELPDGHVYLDGGLERLSRHGTFLGQHIAVPLQGVAVQINACNFPVWGMLEKLAPALLAGVPTIVKPATQTCYLTEACFRMIVKSGLLPEGAVQLVIGGTGDLLDRLGPQDVLSFTGSAETALALRATPNLLRNAVRVRSEQDSLNAAILGPDAGPGSAEFDVFITEVLSEMTVKAGQKCTAIRRILVPDGMLEAVAEALSERLAGVAIGDPAGDVDMGALASAAQKADVVNKIAELRSEAQAVPPAREIPLPDAPGTAFLPPTLLRCTDPDQAKKIHTIEVFGPVATLLHYRDLDHVVALANRGRGSLVTSLFTQDTRVARRVVLGCAAWHGRVYVNNRNSMAEATGHGAPLPHMIHGGPGRAGGGEELGGIRAVLGYMQRTAVQGDPDMLTAITDQWVPGATEVTGPVHPFRRSFEEITVGATLHTRSRVVSTEDITHFAEFTGDTFYAHMDEDAARANPFFPGRVAHGYLLLSFAAGLFVQPDPGPVLANTGLTDLSFRKPICPGDSLTVRLTARRKTRRTSQYGEIAWHVTLFNQHAEHVAEYTLLTMVAYGASE